MPILLVCLGAQHDSIPDSPPEISPVAATSEIRHLIDKGRYREAEAAARTLVAVAERATGPDSMETANALDVLVECLTLSGKAFDPESRKVAERPIRIKETLRGPDDPGLAESLRNLGDLLWSADEIQASIHQYERALAVQEHALGGGHPQVAKTLAGIGLALYVSDEAEKGKQYCERALAIAEGTAGNRELLIAAGLRCLGLNLGDLGELDRALAVLRRALEIRQQVFGPSHPEVAKVLHSMGYLLAWNVGDYAAAKPFMERALAMREQFLGPDHPEVIFSLGHLARIHWQIGDYVSALPLFERAAHAAEKTFGPGHPTTAIYINDLGNFHHHLGDYERSLQLHLRALAIREKALGPGDINVAGSLSNLALLYLAVGEPAKALPFSERAVAIFEKAGATQHPNFARVLNTLASVLQHSGDARGARRTYERALAFWDTAPIRDPYEQALNLHGLAEVMAEEGDRVAALALFERAMTARERSVGPDHLDVAKSLNGRARLLLERGDVETAFESALRAEAIARRQFRATARALAEREALAFELVRSSGLDVALSVLTSGSSVAPSATVVRRLWDDLVRSRGMVLDEMAARRSTIMENEGPGVSQLVASLDHARNRLARLAVAGPAGESVEEYLQHVTDARQEKERAERDLARKSDVFRRELAGEKVGLAAVERGLPSESALVAYVLYDRLLPISTDTTTIGTERRSTPSYLAMVLTPGGGPVLVPLGAADAIERQVRRWREEVASTPRGLTMAGHDTETRYLSAGQMLRQAIWDPVAKHLAGARLVFIVPDGVLHLVNLSTLPAAQGKYLVETGVVLHYLSAEREVVRRDLHRRAGNGMFLLGGADFNATGKAVAAARFETGRPNSASSPTARSGGGAPRGRRVACAEFRSIRFRPLPDSRLEVDEIEDLWEDDTAGEASRRGPLLKLVGAQANEASFKSLVAGHRIVHLATHGFFAQDRCPSVFDAVRPSHGARPKDGRGAATGAQESPLLLAGLALAGANQRGAAAKDDEDGILTAEEIASLDLSAAEWAVLSACETGIGTVQTGEGVLGLRRAFETAGAGTLIMSLWPIEDAAAREWMRELYRGRLSGLSTAESVQRASRRVIDRRRQAGLSTHPSYWGAFVATGDWK